jgi:hypothetical protein
MTQANGSSTNADPPEHTPAGGNAKYLWLANATWDGSLGWSVTGIPTNYQSFILEPMAIVSGATTAVTERFLEAASDDPSAFTSSTEQWVTSTIAIPYAAPSTFIPRIMSII